LINNDGLQDMASDRRNVVFVINSLVAGGAERALMQLLACMRDELADFATHLVLLDREEELLQVPPWVQKHVLDVRYNLATSVLMLTRLQRQLGPIVTLSFLNRANCANVWAAQMLGYPCIISQRGHTTTNLGAGFRAAVNRETIRLTYRRADQVIAVSEGVKDDLTANYGVPDGKVRVIYNPIDTDWICRQAAAAPSIALPEHYVLGIGRLVPGKNFRLLIEAYRASGIGEKLVIMGDGPERSDLEKLISRLGLDEQVLLTGYVDNPYPVIKAASAFVSSSNSEGFPNALVEAMALGCPVVATDCEVGPMEILAARMGPPCKNVTLAEHGILVPTHSIELLAEGIRAACQADLRERYSRRGPARANDFSVSNAVRQYWAALARYVEKRAAA
jgi:glycosyltransferase involved in cell wall biosynthesis